MDTFRDEHREFIAETLKMGVGINQIVDDLVDIYSFEDDPQTREKLYRRVQKIKEGVQVDTVEVNRENIFLATLSPHWRLAHLRQMLRNEQQNSVKIRILKEIRAEEEIIRNREISEETDKPNVMAIILSEMMLMESIKAMRLMREKKRELLIELTTEFYITLGIDDQKARKDAEYELSDEFLAEEARFAMEVRKMTPEEYFKDDPYQYACEMNWIYGGSCIPVNAYDIVEKGKVFRRRCDNVLVDERGNAINKGDLSHKDWLRLQGKDMNTYDYTLGENDIPDTHTAPEPTEDFMKTFLEDNYTPRQQQLIMMVNVLQRDFT